MTHIDTVTVTQPIYTGTRPDSSGTPSRVEAWVGPRASALASVGAGLSCARLVPGNASPAPRMSLRAASQPRAEHHLPSGISTRLEGGTHMGPHGVLNTYVNHGCRCTRCSAASAAYGRELTRRKAYGLVEELVPVEKVAAHVAWLGTQGVGWEQVARLAQVGRTTVEQIVYPTRRRRRGVTPRVATAVMAVTPALDDFADAALIPAAGTQRRLQALMVLGWSITDIQRASGASALGRVLTRDLVTARVARSVRDTYETHWNRSPIATTPHAQGIIDRTRARAVASGWLPPQAWDDDTIDNPDVAAPVSALRTATSQVRIHVDDVAELVAQGATWPELQDRIGAPRNSIEVALIRAGKSELISRITSNRWVAA